MKFPLAVTLSLASSVALGSHIPLARRAAANSVETPAGTVDDYGSPPTATLSSSEAAPSPAPTATLSTGAAPATPNATLATGAAPTAPDATLATGAPSTAPNAILATGTAPAVSNATVVSSNTTSNLTYKSGPKSWLSVQDTGVVSTLSRRAGMERVICYNGGFRSDRAELISTIDDFCSNKIGTHLGVGESTTRTYNWGTYSIDVSARTINGCQFKIDNNCKRLLLKPVDECNTEGENGKQGGWLTDICGQWRIDPNAAGGTGI